MRPRSSLRRSTPTTTHLDRAKLKVALYLFARHGVKVVFPGRFVAVLRTFAAFFAGVGKMHWPGFVAANAAASPAALAGAFELV